MHLRSGLELSDHSLSTLRRTKRTFHSLIRSSWESDAIHLLYGINATAVTLPDCSADALQRFTDCGIPQLDSLIAGL